MESRWDSRGPISAPTKTSARGTNRIALPEKLIASSLHDRAAHIELIRAQPEREAQNKNPPGGAVHLLRRGGDALWAGAKPIGGSDYLRRRGHQSIDRQHAAT